MSDVAGSSKERLDTYTPPEHGWTCFHCGDTFTSEVTAREHFGATPLARTGCAIKMEPGDRQLLRVIRGLESVVAGFRAAPEPPVCHLHPDYTLGCRKCIELDVAGWQPGPPPAAEYDRDKYPTACLAVEARIDDYVQEYEQNGEDEHGRDSCYTPTGQERSMILDAIVGLHADEEFVTLVAAEHAERQAHRAAEGRCLKCGAGGGQHWGRCSGLTKGGE